MGLLDLQALDMLVLKVAKHVDVSSASNHDSLVKQPHAAWTLLIKVQQPIYRRIISL